MSTTSIIAVFITFFLLFCGDEPCNPLDINGRCYEKTTIDIISDNTFIGDDTITITTEEPLNLGIESNFLDRIDSIRIDYDINKITDPLVVIRLPDLEIKSGANKVDLKSPKTFSQPGIYTVEVYAYIVNGDNVSAKITVIVGGVPPRIIAQPESKSIAETESVSFSVGAAGTNDIRYFWYMTSDTSMDGRAINIGDTLDNTYIDDFVEMSDSGYYYCVVKNDFGTTKSRFARLTVTPQVLDPNAPLVYFEKDSSGGSENIDVVIPLKLSAPYDKEVRARISVLASSSARDTADYLLLSGEVVFPAQSTSANLSIDVIDDNAAEKPEIIALQITTARNARIGDPKTHIYTIMDDDVADSTWPEVFFVNSSGSGLEGENASIMLGLDLKTPNWGWVVTVNCRVSAASTASPEDYRFVDTLITFNINETSQRISLKTIRDKISENDETIRLTLSKPSKAVLSAVKPIEYVYTIKDGDICYINFESLEMTGQEGDTANFEDFIKVTLSIPNVNEVTVRYEIVPALSTATNQSIDYLLPGDGFIRFRPGVQEATIPIIITGDLLKEGEEIIAIRLTDPTGGAVIQNSDPFKYIIADNETITISFKKGQMTVPENAGDIYIPVILSGPSSDTIRVGYSISGSAQGTSADYILKNDNGYTLTFLPFEREKNIEITIVDNSFNEPDKEFTIQLENVKGGADIGTLNTHTVTIIDNDRPYFSFSNSVLAVDESAGKVLVPIHLSNISRLPLRVRYTVSGSSTANPGEDFVAFSTDTATFRARDSIFNIELVVNDDNIDENNETVVLTLSTIDSTTSPGSITGMIVTILDNDGPPSVAFVNDTMTVDEGVGDILIPVVVSGVSGMNMSAGYRVDYRSPQCGNDDFILNGNDRIFLGQEAARHISVTIIDDKIAGEADTFTILLYSPQNIEIGAKGTCRIVIRDNDYRVTFKSANAYGTVTPSDAVDTGYNAIVNITATPVNHAHFAGWSASSDDLIISNKSHPTTTLTVKASGTVTALFAPDTFTLQLVSSNTAHGSVDPSAVLKKNYFDLTQINAVPATGYSFSGWEIISGLGKATLTSNSAANTSVKELSDNVVIRANFTVNLYPIEITQVSGNGTITRNPASSTLPYGSTLTLTANPGQGWRFDHWTGSVSGTTNPVNITVGLNNQFSAVFKRMSYELTLQGIAGAVTVSPTSITLLYDTLMTFIPPANYTIINTDKYVFDGWEPVTGSPTISGNLISIKENTTIRPKLIIRTYPLTLTQTSGGTISSTLSPGQSHAYDSPVTLSVTNTVTGYHFVRWLRGGLDAGNTNPLTTTISTNNEFSAEFALNTYTLTVHPPASATITKNPDKAEYQHNETVTLTLNPPVGYQIDAWGGAVSGSDNPTTITITGPASVSATIKEIPGVANVIYVRAGAPSGGDGSNWARAFQSLETALAISENKQVWIAGGTYQPSSTNENSYFAPQAGAQIYGGFSGYESTPVRPWLENPTIISGNNYYRYCFLVNTVNNVLLNGMILEKSVRSCVYINNGSNTTIENCIIRDNNLNKGYTMPRAIMANGDYTTIRNCVFYNNKDNETTSDNDGQALHIARGGALVVNSIFVDNDGPAISNANNDRTATAKIISCTIFRNAGNNLKPGGINSQFGGIEIRGCILYGNTTNRVYGTQIDSAADISFSCIQNSSADSIGVYRKTGNYNAATIYDVNPTFNNSTLPADIRFWYSTEDLTARFIPTNSAILGKATFTNNRPSNDIRGGLRTSPFDYGAYETPYVGP